MIRPYIYLWLSFFDYFTFQHPQNRFDSRSIHRTVPLWLR